MDPFRHSGVFFHPPIHLSIYPSIHLSIYPFVVLRWPALKKKLKRSGGNLKDTECIGCEPKSEWLHEPRWTRSQLPVSGRNRVVGSGRRLTRPPGTRTKLTPPSLVALFLLPRREEFALLVFENQIGVGECLRKPGATSPDNICSFGVVIVFWVLFLLKPTLN